MALMNVAELQGQLGQSEQALDNLQAAVVAFRRSLELAPDDEQIMSLAREAQAAADAARHG